jgi:hypothetical protein
MFDLRHVVRALRQIVGGKGRGVEFMGTPLVLAVPGGGRLDDGSESASKKVGGTPEAGLQMQDSSKFDLLSNFGPREMVAAQSIERVGASRMVTFSVMGTSKGASKVHLMVYAPPDRGAFEVSKECILVACEKMEARLLEAQHFCNTVGVRFPIKDIKLAADNMRAEVVSVVMQHPDVDDFYPLVEMLERIWASLVQREYKGMERDRPRDSEWHFINGMSALATSLISARTKKSGWTATAASSNKNGTKGGRSGAEPVTMLKGCCASFVAGEGACGAAAPGSMCPSLGTRSGRPFRHECPCGEQHKAAACKKLKPKALMAAAKVLLGKK